MKKLFVLGASDPEMAAVEAALVSAEQDFAYAMVKDRRCFPGNAYKATWVSTPSGDRVDLDQYDTIVLVECGIDGCNVETILCDHHHEGDPGFGKPPEEYLSASSLGQVLKILGREPTYAETMIAAADHCLGAAYQGQCPGVDPQELLMFRIKKRVEWLRGLPDDRPEREAVVACWPVMCPDCHTILSQFDAIEDGGWTTTRDGECPCCGYEGWLSSAPPPESPESTSAWIQALLDRRLITLAILKGCQRETIGGFDVINLLSNGTLPELPEVLVNSGECAVYMRHNSHDHSKKIGITGAGIGTVPGPEPVEAFLEAARKGEILGIRVVPESLYGDPARGFAGVKAE